MRFIYSLLSYLLLPVALLRLAKGKKLNRFQERLGFMPAIRGEPIWLHCVSVGEFLAARILVNALLREHTILITTTTQTAADAVLKYYPNQVIHRYFPFDCPLIIKRYLKKANPKMVLLMETEIWANLIHHLHKKAIPTLLINARLSQKSSKKYQHFRQLSAQTLNKLSRILTQDNASEQRFIQLGVAPSKIRTIGNIKFDFAVENNTNLACLENIDKKIVVCASTHESEEQQILNAYAKIKTALNALLIIVPRHPERFESVFALMQSQRLPVCKRSDESINTDCELMLGDSMGEMMAYFQAADVVFIGGSLVKHGGHNMLEPAALAKPILFGPHVFNFAEIAADLTAKNAAVQVPNADALLTETLTLLKQEAKAQQLGRHAQQYFQSKQGVLDKLTQQIESFL